MTAGEPWVLKTIAICKDRFNGVTVGNEAPLCEDQRASTQARPDVSNKTQNGPVIIYSKHKAL